VPSPGTSPSRASRPWPLFRAIVFGLLLSSWVASPLRAFDLVVQVTDDKGEPASHAVVTFTPSGGAPAAAPGQAEMIQDDRKFSPPVLIVPVGSRVKFPNRDEVAHHVYSFSAPRKFDLPLYIGETAEPVLFDKPGVVSLGCNIHDWMVAHIYVSATPFYALTSGNGRATLRGLPAGGGTVEVWHPRLRGKPVSLDLSAGRTELEPVALRLRPEVQRRQAPGGGSGVRYR
jgi:plastocyanin